MVEIPMRLRIAVPSTMPDKWKKVMVVSYELGQRHGRESLQSDLLYALGVVGVADQLREEFNSNE